ncbi:hypothetical protein HK104_010923 [Borealophlyctis nickersoniae]|nr:hypothetical protein HK104_010923 [Borealophlyctis nickersoniae]
MERDMEDAPSANSMPSLPHIPTARQAPLVSEPSTMSVDNFVPDVDDNGIMSAISRRPSASSMQVTTGREEISMMRRGSLPPTFGRGTGDGVTPENVHETVEYEEADIDTVSIDLDSYGTPGPSPSSPPRNDASMERSVRGQSVEMGYTDETQNEGPSEKEHHVGSASAPTSPLEHPALHQHDEHHRQRESLPIVMLVAERYPPELAPGLGEIVRHCVHRNFVTAETMVEIEIGHRVAVSFVEDDDLPAGSVVVRSSHANFRSVPAREKFEVQVSYRRKIEAFRALGRMLGTVFALDDVNMLGTVMNWREDAQFDTIGVMIDCSRGAVLTVNSVFYLLRTCALMGLNTFQLYTEDTYEIPNEPFFGYLRGRFTQEQIVSIDNYAFEFGIEVGNPSFTSLQAAPSLRWDIWGKYCNGHDLRACESYTQEVMLSKSEETYDFIGKILDSASAPLRSKRIHIGMDEAHGVGEGRYKQLFGQKDSTDVFLEHLKRVHEMCKSRGLKPMIWSDMLFTLAAKNTSLTSYYDDKPLPPEMSHSMPSDLDLVYWDYYHTLADDYGKKIRHHRDLGYEPWVAGGIWTWNRFYSALPFTFEASRACLQACKKDAVRNIFVTTWGDDGNECDILSALPGFLYYAEHGYTHETEVDWGMMKRNFAAICGGRLDDWVYASKIDIVGLDKGRFPPNPSKWLLWQDPFYSFLSPQYRELNLEAYYNEIADNLMRVSTQDLDIYPLNTRLRFPALIARALALKAHLREHLVAANSAIASERAQRLYDVAMGPVRALREAVDELWRWHRDQVWLQTYRPFGLEIIEMRYGAIRTRLESLEERVLSVCGVGDGGGSGGGGSGHHRRGSDGDGSGRGGGGGAGGSGRSDSSPRVGVVHGGDDDVEGRMMMGGVGIPEVEEELSEIYVGVGLDVVVDYARAYTPSRSLGTG